jgi:threonine dehydratase
VIDRAITVSEQDIEGAMVETHAKLDSKIEGAAAVAVAGWKKDAIHRQDKEAAVIICGGNID